MSPPRHPTKTNCFTNSTQATVQQRPLMHHPS